MEVGDDVFPDEAVRNLADWIAPVVVDRIIEKMQAAGAAPSGVFQEYNKCWEAAPDGASEERERTPAETRPAQADPEDATVADPGGAQSVEQVRTTEEYDGK